MFNIISPESAFTIATFIFVFILILKSMKVVRGVVSNSILIGAIALVIYSAMNMNNSKKKYSKASKALGDKANLRPHRWFDIDTYE